MDYCKYQQHFLNAIPSHALAINQPASSLFSFLSILGVNFFWHKTYYGIKMQVASLQRQGEQLKALNVLIEGLTSVNFWGSAAKKWWHLMRMSVEVAQELKLCASASRCEPIQRLLKLCTQGPSPWQGYDVAYSFVMFSLWSLVQGKTSKAIEYVNAAIHADPMWGYPEFLMGCYGLIFEGFDPASHFVKAIRKNWIFLQRMEQDLLCQQFPEVIQIVKQQIFVK
jgi:hypothetical protein